MQPETPKVRGTGQVVPRGAGPLAARPERVPRALWTEAYRSDYGPATHNLG